MPDNPYLQWPVFRRSVVAAFQRSLTPFGLRPREISISAQTIAPIFGYLPYPL